MKIGLNRQGALIAILDFLVEASGTLLEDHDDSLPSSVKVFVSIVRKLAAQASGAEIKNLKGATKNDIEVLLTQSKLCTDYAAKAHIQLNDLAEQLTPVIQKAVEEALSHIKPSMEALQPDLCITMRLYLQREMQKECTARLEQAGHPDSPPPNLASIFIDMPVANTPTIAPPKDGQEGQPLPPGSLHQLVRDGGALLRPSAQQDSKSDQEKQTAPDKGRIVLVGGPGQGKSTITQHLCQLHRMAYLTTFQNELPPETCTLLEEIEKSPSAADIPRRARLPFRIVLSRFASRLQGKQSKSLLDYLAQEVAMPERPCSPTDLRHWLVAEPWLVVFDGLDEVPATANRDMVIEAIRNFVAEVHQADADVLIIATTRPQGYNGEFGSFQFKEHHLTPLSIRRALVYAEQFSEARYPKDESRQEQIMKRLQAGVKHDATARLMRSPLQVTIMVALVDRIGEPPRERWRLFDDYYRIVYQRETERDISAVAILKDQRTNVEEIHRRVALRLHSESEAAGKTQAHLDQSQFRQLVHNRIKEEGHKDPKLKQITGDIVMAALERLVLLVAPEENKIGFEIRSLQEFMASEALCQGSDEEVRKRLVIIAPIPHWRNVFLYAAGRCFAKNEHRRDIILGICDELDHADGDPLHAQAKTGARLAVELLVEGIAREQPNFLRSLVRSGTRLFDTADTEGCRLLSDMFDPRATEEYKNALSKAISGSPPARCWGAWAALIRLVEAGQDWAIDLARTHWPLDIEVQQDVMWLAELTITNPFLVEQAIKLKPTYPVWDKGRSPHIDMASARSKDISSWWDFLNSPGVECSIFDRIQCHLTLDTAKTIGYTLSLCPVNTKEIWRVSVPEVINNLHDSWLPVLAAARFVKKPTHNVLADQLQWLSNHWKGDLAPYLYRTAWPFSQCILCCRLTEDLRHVEYLQRLAKAVRDGQLGTYDDWMRAEDRWKKQGVNPGDFEVQWPEGVPFDQRISQIGFPCLSLHSSLQAGGDTRPLIEELLSHFDRSGSDTARASWAELVIDLLETDVSFFGVRKNTPPFKLSPLILAALYRNRKHRSFSIDLLHNTIPENNIADIGVFDALDDVGRFSGNRYIARKTNSKRPSDWYALIYDAFRQSPEQAGLIRLASTSSLSGNLAPKDVIQTIDPNLLDEYDLVAWATLRLCTDDHQVETCRLFIRKYLSDHKHVHLLSMICEGMRHGGRDDPSLEVLTIAAAQEIECRLKIASDIHRQLTAAVGRRQSQLTQPESCRKLGLPEPL